MMRVLLCLGQEHDLRLVSLAVLICFGGSAATVQLYARIGAAGGGSRRGWLALTAVASGTMVWCTHFVAMLAFRTLAPVELDPLLTLTSLLIAVSVTALGLAVASAGSRRANALVGGAIVGLSIAAMHYVGMAAYRVDGLVLWDLRYVAASVALSVALSATALDVLRLKGRLSRRTMGVMLIGTAVAALHFTGMAAMTVVPTQRQGPSLGLSEGMMAVLAIATALGAMLVIGCAAVSALIDEQNQSENYRRLRHMAHYDGLTELPNRTYFDQLLKAKLADLGATAPFLAVLMIDLSQFKRINDRYGHQAGDQLLLALASRLKRLTAEGEVIARIGGDEFVALKPYRERCELDQFLSRVAAVVAEPFVFEHLSLDCSFNIGIALAPEHGRNADALLASADLAMYRAKAERSRVPSFYTPEMDEAVKYRQEIGYQLRAAIGTDQFHIAYQVQASLIDGRIIGYEALARWIHPVHGNIPPGVFIPLAEELGEIVRLGDWVLRTACREAASWTEPHCLAVNVSPLQLGEPLLVDKVEQALAESGLPAGRLELELTESAIIKDRDRALHKLRQIKMLGVKVALDDFGAGFSSLEVLRSFPFDKLKLDASFVEEIERSPSAVAILRAVADLGRELAMPVLAEGVETMAQLEIVRRAGCIGVQGYLLGRPDRVPKAPLVAAHGPPTHPTPRSRLKIAA